MKKPIKHLINNKESLKHLITLCLLSTIIFSLVVFRYTTLNEIFPQGLPFPKMDIILLVIGAISTIAIIVAYYFLLIKDVAIEKVYAFSILILAGAYMLIFPIGTVPDELTHFYSAYRYSNFFSFNFEQFSSNLPLMRQSDIDNSINVSNAISIQNYSNLIQNFEWFCKDNTIVEYNFPCVVGVPIGYVVSGLGIAIGKMFNFSFFPLFYTARIFNIIAFATITYFAIKKLPFGKSSIFIIATLPMTLHLVASASYDGILISLLMLFFAQFVKMMYGEEKITNKDIVVCCIIAFALVPLKMVYLPLFAAPLCIKNERFNAKSQRVVFMLKMSIAVAALIGLLIPQLKSIINIFSPSDEKTLEWAGGETGYSALMFLTSPLRMIKLFFNTILVKGDFYLSTLVGGSLGWFQISTPTYLFMPFWIFIILSFVKSDNYPIVRLRDKSYLSLLCISTFFLVLLGLLLIWTPISFNTIEGVQGRYFLPIIPFLILIFRNDQLVSSHSFKSKLVFAVLYWNIIFAIELSVKTFTTVV